jgi:hypothetical protein
MVYWYLFAYHFDVGDIFYRLKVTLPNWLTVFLFGMYMRDKRETSNNQGLIFFDLEWVVLTILWAMLFNILDVGSRFPFRGINVSSNLLNSYVESLCI